MRSSPSTDNYPIASTLAEREVQIFGFMDVPGWQLPWIAVWYEGRIRWVYGGQIKTEWDDKRPISEEDASLKLLKQNASMEDALWIQQLTWF